MRSCRGCDWLSKALMSENDASFGVSMLGRMGSERVGLEKLKGRDPGGGAAPALWIVRPFACDFFGDSCRG